MLKVLKSGFYTTIQDKGRVGYASFGVPISGSMDSFSADLANRLLNNSINDAVLEIAFGNVSFLFTKNTTISITGADCEATLNGELIAINKKIFIKENSILSLGNCNFGSFTYIAINKGFKTAVKLKSRSYFKNITKDSVIKKGDELLYEETINSLSKPYTSIKIKNSHFYKKELNCYKGPEFHLLNDIQKNILLSKQFTISKNFNRMGYRLTQSLENSLPQLLTSSVLPGTVQLTPSGKLIILMRGCQVTGGYPRILQLSENAINILSQKKVENTIKFSLTSI